MSAQYPQGPGWSPDGGYYWVRGESLYWSDGTIADLTRPYVIRASLDEIPESEWHKYEDFSQWSIEKRATVLEENKAQSESEDCEKKRYEASIKELCILAKSKLTKEEYEAVQKRDYDMDMPMFDWEALP